MADRRIFNKFRINADRIKNPFSFMRDRPRQKSTHPKGFRYHYRNDSRKVIINGTPRRYKHLQEYPKLIGIGKNGVKKVLTRHGIIHTRKTHLAFR